MRSRGQPGYGEPGLTPRSFLAGILLVLAVAVGTPYSIWIVGSSELTWSYFPVGVGAPFFALLFANAALRRLWRRAALNASELITVLVMGLAASGIPTFMVAYVLAMPTGVYYGANRENRWAELIHPHLPDWAVVSDPEAVRIFYEGRPLGSEAFPIAPFIGPVLWWLSLLAAIYLASFCLVVLFRRQWVEHERLAFPLAEVPLLLTRTQPGAESALPAIVRAAPFWIGCAVPLLPMVYNAVGYFEPAMAPIPLFGGASSIALVPGASVPMKFYFPVIGFAYLVPTPVTLSIWFFYLLVSYQGGLIETFHLGIKHPEPFVWGWQSVDWQTYGAFMAMVAWSLWLARRHLCDVVLHAFGSRRLDDADELVSYRFALIGFALGTIWAIGWLWQSGLTPPLAVALVLVVLAVYLGITRLVVQTGVHYLTTPITAQGLVLAGVGTALPPSALVGLTLSYGWCGDVQSIFMTSVAHAGRLNELCLYRRHLAAAMAIAVVVGFAACIAFVFHLCFEYGAIHFRNGQFNPLSGPVATVFNSVAAQLREPRGPDAGRLGLFGIGFLLYSLIAWSNYRFPWWPLHPIGLTLASTWMTREIVFSVFIAWMLKSLILRFGGPGTYRRLRPFFLGLPVGFFLGVGLSFLIDALFFKGSGHPILHG